ncbi:MAG: Stk1 family PASTA domain-containing Ser/Thr kinase [Clostridia bacterium]|nr:Stk1 family PASTA domain-containing Ser/Thr kinase [Clostridia bacterium]
MSSRILANRYELLERIGDGGMAVVYKARCRLLNRFVAIKILKPEFTKDVKFIENFRKESQAAASLNHPNIVNIYDVGREGNINYIVMELIEGPVLSDLIRENGPMPWEKAVEITMQIASALSFAHKNHIIHRDVKPHNILIAKDGSAKITDFGIAKAANSSTIAESTGTIMGSVHYFSPEQARGGYVDEKSDIYSLGIVLYELLTGKVPFDGDNPVAVALMHINDEITPPSQLIDGIPPRLEQVVMKATNKFQVNRYATADEMYIALKSVKHVASIVGDSVFAGSRNYAGSEVRNLSDLEGIGRHENEIGPERPAANEAAGESVSNEPTKSKNGKKKGKKVRLNKVKLAAIIAALVCAIPVSMFIVNGFSGFSGTEVKVPDFLGMTFEQAEDAAEDSGLKVEIGDEVYSSDYDEGKICSQTPKSGSKVKNGKTVTVNISKGAKENTVPNLIGKSYDDAVFLLEKYGYKVGKVTVDEASDMPKDAVVEQSPESGETAKPGSSVSFVISAGTASETIEMPMLLGTSIDSAKKKLEDLGLKVGNVSTGKSDAYGKDEVMWQQYEAGHSLKKGDSVDLKVSGESEAPSSKSVSLSINYSAANNEVFYLTVLLNDDNGSSYILQNAQRIKSNGSETLTVSGTGSGTITVYFDNDVVMKKNADFTTGALN